jgi:hypothetical protein
MVPKDFEFIPTMPWRWFVVASYLPGKALAVGCLIHLAQRISTRNPPIPFSHRYWINAKFSRYVVWNGIKTLEKAGLITVERRSGSAPRIAIISDPRKWKVDYDKVISGKGRARQRGFSENSSSAIH